VDARDFDAEIAGLKESVFAARQAAASAHREMVEQFASWFAGYALAVARKNVELQHDRTETIGAEQVKALRDEVRGVDWGSVVRKAFQKPALTVHNLDEPDPETIERAEGVRPSFGGRSPTLEEWEQAPVREVCNQLASLLCSHGYEPHIYDATLTTFSSTLHRVPDEIRQGFDAFGSATESMVAAYTAVRERQAEKSRAAARAMWDAP
jgi:hypothetical protein